MWLEELEILSTFDYLFEWLPEVEILTSLILGEKTMAYFCS